MTSEDPAGFLTLRAGAFQRNTRATRDGGFRAISVSDCPVTNWNVIVDGGGNKVGGHSFRQGEQFKVFIAAMKPGKELWDEDPEKDWCTRYRVHACQSSFAA